MKSIVIKKAVDFCKDCKRRRLVDTKKGICKECNCRHDFEWISSVGGPSEPSERYFVCKLCGHEHDEEED